MSARRRLAAVAAGLVLVVVVLGVLAVVTVAVLPAALALGAAVLALVAGAGSRAWHTPGRRRAATAPRPPSGARPDVADARRWTTRWELGVPVDAVPLVRDRAVGLLHEWGLTGEAAEPTLLVVTELVSNAAEHGCGPAWLGIEPRGGAVRVEVHDGAPEPPLRLPHDPARPRGRGLSLVDAVSSRWGVTDDPPGKVVWAEVPTAWPP